ncbi:protein SERAC1 [Daktulosphaira vitifoliae]|uniref:protein SERAC1 n=1 Tax=Daktulosphaira vitifoliae TaxID=58002 RepID=UPI0021AA797D|nr:protein SERAC1 [Daktulosphaira vitifoliae]
MYRLKLVDKFYSALITFKIHVHKNQSRLKLLTECISLCVVTGSFGWFIYEIQQTYNVIKNIVQKDPLLLNNNRRPQYIFLNKATFTEFDEYQIIDSNSILKPTNPLVYILQLWNDIKYKKAVKLLELSNNSTNKKISIVANHHLATMAHLKRSDCYQIAQMSNAHTMVGFARTSNVNPNFFLPPKKSKWSRDETLNEIRNLLIKLNGLSEHKCLSYFVAFAFKDHTHEYFHPEDVTPDFRSMHVNKDNIFQLSVSALRHHCSNETNINDMIKQGGLHILMAVYQEFKNDQKIAEQISQLLSTVSLYQSHLQDIFLTGWISVLYEWKNHSNFRIQSWANRTLLNLDKRDYVNGNNVYGKQTVLLHPKNRCQQDAKIDVILVHGLLGGVSFSWRARDININQPIGIFDINKTSNDLSFFKKPVGEAMQDYLENYSEVKDQEWDEIGNNFEFILKDLPISDNIKGNELYTLDGQITSVRKNALNDNLSQCWPSDWLPTDVDGLRVIGVDYSSTLSEWLPSCPLKSKNQRTLEGRTEKLMEQLLAIGVGDRPVIFLAHSMGGLLVKKMLVTARNSTNPDVRKIFEKTRSVFFFSTPHHGSPLATLNSAYRFFLWPSVEVDELRTDSPKLLSLHNEFLDCLRENPMKIVTFAESLPTEFTALKVPILCVPIKAADPSVGELYELPLNHMSICKAESKLSFVYQKTLSVIKTIATYSSVE